MALALPRIVVPRSLAQAKGPIVQVVQQRSGSRAAPFLKGQKPRCAAIESPRRHLSTSRKTHLLASPLNIPKWLNENSHLLQPPVNNYCVYNKEVTVMIVGGPNARTDYHINETAEWFYQYKGPMLLKVIEDGVFRDITIGEGEMFLLPPNTPHNPVRFANTVGIVLEQHRPENSVDRLRWYCQNCGSQVHEASFHCTDLGTQIKAAVNAFKEDTEARKCGNCGEVCDVAPRVMPRPGVGNGSSPVEQRAPMA